MSEDSFIDGESSYNLGKTEMFSFKSILMRHLERITRLASVEFKGGFTQQKTIPINGTLLQQEVYIGDTRDSYINAIENLADLLYPHFDTRMKEAETQIIKEIDDANKTLTDDEVFKNEKRRITRKLFRELCSFLYREKYLELGSYED